MKKAAIYSAILHVAIFVILIVGLYNPFARTFTNQQSMMIDFVQIAEQSAAPKLTPKQSVKPAAKPKTEEKPKPEPEPEPEPAPTPPQPEEKPAPEEKPTPPTPQPETKPELAPIPSPEKPKEQKKPPVIKPKLKPKAELSVEKKKTAGTKQSKKKAQKDNFEKMLADIEKGETAETESGEEGAPASTIGDTLTGSEIDLIRQQIARCWHFPAGAKGDQDLVVDIELKIDPDGTVTQAEIVDQARMNKDPFFRTAAESARRAVLNPQCSPLKLPPDKYNQWKHIILGFNPKDLFQ